MIPTTERKETAIRLATAKGFVTVRQLAARFCVTRSAIQDDLAALIKTGELVREGRGSNTYYRPSDAK